MREHVVENGLDMGAAFDGDDGRMLIRPSGTEPLARVMVESPDADTAAVRIAAALDALLTKVT